MKKFIFCIIFFALLAVGTNAYAMEILFEHREQTEISRGVVYERNRMMTNRGMVDVHVLFADVSQPYITLAPVATSRDWGLRETTSRLLSDAGAVGGVNADFFNMARLYSVYLGPMVRDGQVVSLNAATNAYSHYIATFFLDSNYNPFFKYMRTTMNLYANGARRANVVTYNSIGASIYSPVVVSRAAMNDTSAIDARVPYTTKIVVENGAVTQVTGQTVQTPANGFVIIIPSTRIEYYRHFFLVGTRVDFRVSTDINVDFSNINAAVGGGAIILENGEIMQGRGIEPNRRHPRTAVGQLRDGSVILVTVDGRSHSIGVTHAELGMILLHYGAVNAMHMDGGGSTTMVTRMNGTYSVANTPSDGSQRRVTNALGIFNNAPVGDMVRIVIEPAENRAVLGVPMPASVFGEDIWGNRVPLGLDRVLGFVPEEVRFHANQADGFWYNGRYTPTRTGRHTLTAFFGTFSANAEIYVYHLAELLPRHGDGLSMMEGERTRLRFSGIAADGTQVNIPEVVWLRASPAYLGRFENGYFIAESGGAGYIAAAVGSIRAYIPVTVGGFPWPIDMFASHMGFLSVPAEYVHTQVTTESAGGREVIRLDYRFGRTTRTQASYVTFYPALQIPGEPIALRLQVFGDGSGHWLRGRVRDGNGSLHNIDFARVADFTGWERVTATLPNAPAPFSLDRLYMVTLENDTISQHMVVFYGLEALYAPNQIINLPQGTIFNDRLRANADLRGVTGGGSYEFAIASEGYAVRGVGRFAVVNMTAQGGGIQSANVYQWGQLLPNVRALNLPYVVILLDQNPRGFARRMEYELFHLMMTDLRNDGRTVFVVSPGADETTLNMRDGVRYISSASDIIRFFTDGARIWWVA